MMTDSPLVLYQIEAIGVIPEQARHAASQKAPLGSHRNRAQRTPSFLVQLMVGGDPDLRKALGRKDHAGARAAAYGAALEQRPSQATKRQARVIGAA